MSEERKSVDDQHWGLESVGTIRTTGKPASNPYQFIADELNKLEEKIPSIVPEEPNQPLPPLVDGPAQLGPALFDQYSQVLQHWEFISTVTSHVESRLIVLTAELGYIKARMKKEKVDSGVIEAEPEYVKCNEQLINLKAQLVLLETQKSNLSRRMQFLSRSVEGSKLDQALGGRAENIGRRRKSPYEDPW